MCNTQIFSSLFFWWWSHDKCWIQICFLLSQGAAGYAPGAAGYATCAAGYATGAAGYAIGAAGYATGAAAYATCAAGYDPWNHKYSFKRIRLRFGQKMNTKVTFNTHHHHTKLSPPLVFKTKVQENQPLGRIWTTPMMKIAFQLSKF